MVVSSAGKFIIQTNLPKMKYCLHLLSFFFCITAFAQEQMMVTYENIDQDTTYPSIVAFVQGKYIRISYKDDERWKVFDKVTGKTKTIWFVGERKLKTIFNLYEEKDKLKSNYIIEYDTTDRREILEIDCFKVTIKDETYNTVYHLYLNQELSNEPFHPLHKMFPELKGFPLSIENNGRQRVATKISNEIEPDFLNTLNEDDSLIVIDLADIKEVMKQKPDSIMMGDFILEYLSEKYK